MQYQSITYSVKHFNCQFHRVLVKLHILISLLFGIPHGRSRWTWASAQTYKERRRKRNNNKLNHVWTTTASQVSWIFAMNSKLNRSSLYYWQQDMLIVFVLFFMEPYWWTILKLCYWGLKIIYNLRTFPQYLKIRRHEFCANRWQSMKFATT